MTFYTISKILKKFQRKIYERINYVINIKYK